MASEFIPKEPASLRPTPLRSGDLVALVAPAGACQADRLDAGIAILESWGLRVRSLPTSPPHRYLAARDDQRAAHLAETFADPEVRAVLCARGGYGCSRLAPLLDVGAMVTDPKIFVGFSDVTLLLDRLVTDADMVAFHGPMVAADLARLASSHQERFRRFLFGEEGWWDGSCSDVWRDGVGEGRLAGGCLSVLVTSLGTPWEIDTRGCVLFLEDVAEKPYRIDRMMTHMKQAGKFDEITGVVFGPMLDCDGGQGIEVLADIVLDVLEEHEIPVLYGLDAGHGAGNVVLPFGSAVRLDGGSGGLELLESPFRT